MDLYFLKKGFLMLLLLNAVNGYSQTSEEEEASAFQLNATYKGDLVSNFRGGIATGTTYLGLADLFLHFNTDKGGLWRGGDFLIHGANSHGGEPSAHLVGDFQGISNIEAGNHTFLYELWYKQTIANVSATIGLQDMNTEFANSEVGSYFLNSSFGIHSVIADNIAAPVFPLTSMGLTLCWEVNERTILKTAIYSGCPINFDSNPYNLNWELTNQESLLWVTESKFTWGKGACKSGNVLKAGVFFHQHCPDDNVVNTQTGENLSYDYGFYLAGDHQLVLREGEGGGLKVFYQVGLSPRNDNFGYFGAGCAYSGLLSSKGNDVLGLAMADGLFTDVHGKDETTFELTYKVQLNQQIYLQPDLQYVMHPGGTDEPLKNATVGLLRLGMEF
ncbi:MAG TPA: carbohydrate porin [Prolixibacteraceae bacterium]|jgi:porin